VKLLDFQELQDLRDVLKGSRAHIRHLLGLLDALFDRHQVGLVVVISHHSFLHLGQVLEDLTLALGQCLKEEDLLFCQRLRLVLQVLLSKQQDAILLLDDFILVLQVLNLLVELADLLIIHLLQRTDLVFEGLELLISTRFLVLLLTAEAAEL